MTISRDLARRELRVVLDGLADELRRREAASAGRVRTQVHRASVLYAIADVSLPALPPILRRTESAAEMPDKWVVFSAGASALADQVKELARATALFSAEMRAERPRPGSARPRATTGDTAPINGCDSTGTGGPVV